MTVVDTSAVVDFLLGSGVASQVEALIERDSELAAPDVLVFETLAVLRRDLRRRILTRSQASAAVSDLGDVGLALFPTLGLCDGAWALRQNFRMADALFVALALRLGESLATKDRPFARAVAKHTGVHVTLLE